MASYSVYTTVPVVVTISTDDEKGVVTRVVVEDHLIDATLEELRNSGGRVEDENGLETKHTYDDGTEDEDWELIRKAYDESEWPAWEFGW